MLFGMVFGFFGGVVCSRLWKPILGWYLRKEKEIVKELDGTNG